jgi:serine phosphatase RsbU (regulator of sigma subunit)
MLLWRRGHRIVRCRLMLRSMDRPQGVGNVASVLDAAESAPPVEAVEAVTRELGLTLRATAVSLLIADHSGRALVRLAHVPLDPAHRSSTRPPSPVDAEQEAKESATVVSFDGGPEEQAVRTQTVQVLPPSQAHPQNGAADYWRVLAPVTERGEALGLLELCLPEEPGPEVLADITRLAHLTAYVVIASRRHTDLFEWGQRSRPFSLSAEIQQRLLPAARTCEAAAFTLSGWLEPAADIAGDTFDYSLARDVLHLSMTDAMGHGVAAAMTATLCVSSLRLARRRGASLLEQAAAANAAMSQHAYDNGGDDYVTGLVGRVLLRSGDLDLINAGHVAPYLARRSTVTTIDLPADLPLGVFPDTPYRRTRMQLEPGDRLVLVTDGMLERNAAGLDFPRNVEQTRSLNPREAVRALTDSALAAAGHVLRDDATVLCLDWHGGHGRGRATVAGADRTRASHPLA